MTGLATNFVEYFKGKRETALETLVRITFGTFMGGLVLLLTLLYSGCRLSDRTGRDLAVASSGGSECWLSFTCSRSGASRQSCMRA